MLLDLAAVQQSLREDHLDGWLLYDFRGANPIAATLTGAARRHTTRRWFYFAPATGGAGKLVHAIEPGVLDDVPGETFVYSGRVELERGLRQLLGEAGTVAMEYSPDCAIPYLSRVDAGTVELLRGWGVTIVSSGDLVGRFEAAWSAQAVATHRSASERLYRIKDRAFQFVGGKLASRQAVHEFEVQQAMVGWFEAEGLVSDAPPLVAAQENSGNPHYSPTAERSRPIRPDELLLLDLWGKIGQAGSVYADITWVGFAGDAPAKVIEVFDAAVAGRDAAVTHVQSRVAGGEPVFGWEVDRAARDVISRAGYGDRFIHRTGHSLGEEVHGNGVHMDDYETHDDRRIWPGSGFTIEPGIYTRAFGVRTEINMVVGAGSAEVTGPRQQALVRIATGQ